MPLAYKKWVPLPSAVSIPFIVGPRIAIDFCLGGFIVLMWYAGILHPQPHRPFSFPSPAACPRPLHYAALK